MPDRDQAPEHTPRSRPRRRSRARFALTITGLIVALLGIAAVAFPGTAGNFIATITANENSAGTRTFFTCHNAQTQTPNAYLVWAMQPTGTTEPDLSGMGRSGTYTTSPTTTSDSACVRDAGGSVVFNGTNTCVYDSTPLANPTVFSLEAWFKTTTKRSGNIWGFADNKTVSPSANDRHLAIDSKGRVMFAVYPGSVQVVSSPLGVDYADGNWHHVVATLSSSGIQLYADGALVGSKASITSAQNYTGYWRVGCGQFTNWPDGDGTNAGNYPSYFTGEVQNAAIYTTPLTAQQVHEHYVAGTP